MDVSYNKKINICSIVQLINNLGQCKLLKKKNELQYTYPTLKILKTIHVDIRYI